jgi:hypothetical protein
MTGPELRNLRKALHLRSTSSDKAIRTSGGPNGPNDRKVLRLTSVNHAISRSPEPHPSATFHFHADPRQSKAMKTSITSNLRPLLRNFYPFLIAIAALWAIPRNAHAQLLSPPSPVDVGTPPSKPYQPQAPDNQLQQLVNKIDQNQLQATVQKLVSFGTRHTASSQTDPIRGIGAATACFSSSRRMPPPPAAT